MNIRETMVEAFLRVERVRKTYGSFEALRGVSFDVGEGELFGLLGPNGAGKTTLLSILACLSRSDGGAATLGSRTIEPSNRSLKPLVGIGTQDLAVYPELTARENLRFFGKLYGLEDPLLRKREDEVLDRIGLADRADQRVAAFSGGMKRRLNLGVAIVHQPKILFLDEPTTGVDPQSRNHIFEHVRELNAKGMTVVYTSHYMEEVQALCPRIAIMDAGKVVACDTLPNLLRRQDAQVRLTVAGGAGSLAELMRPRVNRLEERDGGLTLLGPDASAMLLEALREASSLGLEVTGVHTAEPNLEAVFLQLTDRALRD